jgi:hypothetical protein
MRRQPKRENPGPAGTERGELISRIRKEIITPRQGRNAEIRRDRRRCERLLRAHLGEGGFQEFLRNRQPDLGERTGRELLDGHPVELLARLEMMEGGKE